MAGIYIHIPYCKQACYYCNFHFSTTLRSKPEMLAAILQEMEWQRDYLRGAPLDSIYLGGGTPSLLDAGELEALFNGIYRLHNVRPGAEITLEANPDDLSRDQLRALREGSPVNRLSIGIQSFSDADLEWMHRAHNAAHARACLDDALAAGFDDLTIDLIYGSPSSSDEQWAENLRIAFEYRIPHLSCYCLTVEEGTALGTFVKRGKRPPVDEERAARQLEYLMERSAAAGYEQYEISNFALPGRYARHNSAYWKGEPYLGLGPSAHSFDGASRQWNVANNALYIKGIQGGSIPFEREILTLEQRYNEYVMTGLRTSWGVDRQRIEALDAGLARHFLQAVAPYLSTGEVVETAGAYRLTNSGKMLADRIAMELFVS